MAFQTIHTVWRRLQTRFGESRTNWLSGILLLGLAPLIVRLLMETQFDHTALLYVGVPYLISLLITLTRPMRKEKTWWQFYIDHMLAALAVFLGSSILLFEGFVCVLFFIPIYLLIVSIAFAAHAALLKAKERNRTYVSVLPLLLIALSFEGTTDVLTIERANSVSVSKTITLEREAVLSNLAKPFDLRKDRHWLLRIFPMPYQIDAGSLAPGDVHTIKTRYHRWFVANTHEGEAKLQIVAVEPHRIQTRFISDTTFFASYLRTVGTEITLVDAGPGQTTISLRIDYERTLDPAWYFHPLQQFGMTKMADFLIDEVMIRDR
ncbi:MAG: hypothetical protein AAGC71_14260 [Pseudomonadota bacterium]